MTYTEIENILKDINDPKLPQIFHFSDTPNESEFQKIFDFYSETLMNFSDYGLDPVFIYFNQRWSKNAFACKRNQYSIVSFDMGLIRYLTETFDNILFVSNNASLDTFLGTTAKKLMYQIGLHFTLYHEMGHLIQNSEYLLKQLSESHLKADKYDEKRHLLELDADQFSSLSVGAHVDDYLDRIDPNGKTPELEEHVLVIAIAGLMIHVLSFYSANEPLYLREHCHPHPCIRLSSINQTVVDYVFQARHGRSSTSMERVNILVRAGNLVQNSTKSNVVINFIQMLRDNFNEIKVYLDSFTLINNGDTVLATDKWNEKANRIKK
jgi:hypothetical protein